MRLVLLALCFAAVPVQAQDPIVWEPLGDRPVNAAALAFDAAGALWAVARDSTFRLDAGSAVWNAVAGFGGGAILPLGSDTLLATNFEGVHRSVDGGQTWERVHTAGHGRPFVTERGAIVVGNVFYTSLEPIARSTDRGATWTDLALAGCDYAATTFVSIPAGTMLPNGEMLANERVIAKCDNDLVYSDDDGLTWPPLPSPFGYIGTYGALTTTSRGRIWFAGCTKLVHVNQLYLSEDGGHTWTLVLDLTRTPDQYDCWTAFVAVPAASGIGPGVLYGIKMSGAVFRTTDLGQTWETLPPLPLGQNEEYMRDVVLGPEGRLYVSTYRTPPNRGWAYRTANPVPAGSEGIAPEREDTLRLTVTPNPARGQVTLTVELSEAGPVRAAVYDVLGRAVGSAYEGVLAAGTHRLAWDTEKLGAGTYLAAVTGPSGRLARRFTVVK